MKAKIMNCWALLLLGLLLLLFTLWGTMRDPFTMTLSRALSSPAADLPFGADHLGRDVLARVAHGFFQDMRLSFTVVCFSALMGVSLGLVAGYAAGWFDHLLTLVMDAVLSLPHIVLAMVIMLYLSYSFQALVIALVLPGWVKYARIIRTQVLALKEADFIVYERVIGAGFCWICFRHLLPNVILPVIGLLALHLGHTLLSVAALGFLGLGLQPPTPEWGTMIMEARPYIMQAPWAALFPGFFIFAFIFFFTLMGRRFESRFQTERNSTHAYH